MGGEGIGKERRKEQRKKIGRYYNCVMIRVMQGHMTMGDQITYIRCQASSYQSRALNDKKEPVMRR